MPNMDLVQQLIALDNEKKELEEKLEAVKASKKETEEALVREFEKEGLQSIKAHGKTLYLKRDLWAKVNPGFESEDAIEALKAAGLADEYVKESYNSRSVSSFFKEREKNGEEPVPEELRGVFTTSETFSIGMRKA